MDDPRNSTATIAEQIYALMMVELEADEAFDERSLTNLRDLVAAESLTNRKALLQVIKAPPEERS